MRAGAAFVAGLSALAALLGALGVEPLRPGDAGKRILLVDLSPSCEPPEPLPEGSVPFSDSDIGAALERARAEGAARILLLTDACDTGGNPRKGISAVPVDVRLLPRRDEVSLLRLETPARIRVGEEFAIEIEVGRTAGAGGGEAEVLVTCLRDGERVGEPATLLLRRGERRTLRLPDRVDRAGAVRYRARLSAPFGEEADDERETGARVGEQPIALAVGAELPPGFHGERVEPADLPRAIGLRSGALDVILLAGSPIPEASQRAVAEAVRAGCGLLVVGGGGYAGRPLEAILPVTDSPPGGRAVCLLLDYSGSMTALRDELQEAVARLKSALRPEDRVALALFRDEAILLADWRPVREEGSDLRSIPTRYRTEVRKGLALARSLLERAGPGLRRLYVVSDAEWTDLTPEGFEERLRELNDEGIDARLVRVGREADPAAFRALLERAEAEAPDRRIEGPVGARLLAPASWIEPALPPLREWRGLVRLFPRNVGERIALLCGDSPLLATLEPGGRVAVLAGSDASLGAILDACARPRPAASADLRARRRGSSVEAEGRGEEGGEFLFGERRVPARPAGPGRFRAGIENAPPGELRVRWRDAEVILPPRAAAELEGLEPRADLAARIALESGGRLLGPEEPPPAPARVPAARKSTLPLLAAAMLLLAAALRSRR